MATPVGATLCNDIKHLQKSWTLTHTTDLQGFFGFSPTDLAPFYTKIVELRELIMPRLLLEPEWWAKARHLNSQGISTRIIAERLNKNIKTVRDVLNPEARERNKEKCRKQHLERKSQTGKCYDFERQRLRRHARLEFKENGGDLREIYERWDCL